MMYPTQTQAQTLVNSVSLSALKVPGAFYVIKCEEGEGKRRASGTIIEEFDYLFNETDSRTVVGLVMALMRRKEIRSPLQERAVQWTFTCRAPKIKLR